MTARLASIGDELERAARGDLRSRRVAGAGSSAAPRRSPCSSPAARSPRTC